MIFTPDRQINPDSFYRNDEETEEVKFCKCGNKLHNIEQMCDDCLCELEDPTPLRDENNIRNNK